jgi:hypothetical protein
MNAILGQLEAQQRVKEIMHSDKIRSHDRRAVNSLRDKEHNILTIRPKDKTDDHYADMKREATSARKQTESSYYKKHGSHF